MTNYMYFLFIVKNIPTNFSTNIMPSDRDYTMV